MDYIKKYENGLTLILSNGNFNSVTCSIMVNAGSGNETAENNGISHYIEHMCFKGTNSLTARDITNKLDDLGASYNAYTSVDTTCYYVKVIKEKTEKAFEILSDIVLNSTFLDDEAVKEKAVILEEIKMCEDSPEDVCSDLSNLSYFGKGGYGQTILGTEKNLLSFTKKDVLNYLNKYYVSSNMVITFVGDITLKECESLIEKYITPNVKIGYKPSESQKNLQNQKGYLSKNKDIEQVHFSLTFNSVDYLSKDKGASEIATIILGAGMSSRLFRRVREEMGLCYSIYAGASRYKDVGTVSIVAGVNKDKYLLAYEEVLKVIKEYSDNGATYEEFERAKTRLLSYFTFAKENSMEQVQLFSRYYLLTGELYNNEKRIKDMKSVTIEEVNKMAKQFNKLNMSTAIVGKKVKPLKI